MCGQAPLLA
ncbi:hypothetical protein Pint_18819 [Pistacia integerrima]|uniref:Uncharacterized protein n=1 Tax=Pistacia integerrima TaxID=434235 RepID=A0ACC0YYJ6_9ROSI|nr:hypothetical protein Pint_18819 [Pistacia integerrima]